MYTNSWPLNKITIKYIFHFPRMDDLMDYLSGANYFSKKYLNCGYHQIHIREGDEWKMIFNTQDGLFEWLAMFSGLTNDPSTFVRLVNEILKPFLGSLLLYTWKIF